MQQKNAHITGIEFVLLTAVMTSVILCSAGPAACFVVVTRVHDRAAIGYTSTDGEGRYTVNFRSEADSVVIRLSGMSIKDTNHTVPNLSGRYDFDVEEFIFELDEVKIQAVKIELKGDETQYKRKQV